MENRTNLQAETITASEHNKVVIAQIQELVKQLKYDPTDFKDLNWLPKIKSRPSQLHIAIRKIVLADLLVSILSGMKIMTGIEILSKAENTLSALQEEVVDQYRIPAEDGSAIHDLEDLYGTLNVRVPLKMSNGVMVNDYGYLEKGDPIQPGQVQ